MNTYALTPALLAALAAPAAHAAADETSRQIDTDAVMIVTAPALSPLEVVTSPKTPRQPVPASDGADYLKTIPGFSQIRNGGTNGDPVLRGMFGSRLRILTNNGEMLGACPSRMDAPTSYLSPENFDVLTLIKGPETVLWGPGNSAGTLRFDREPPHFDAPGVTGSASLLAGSNRRWDNNADVSLGSDAGYLRLTGNTSRANDYRDGNGERVPSKWDKWNGDMAVGWTPDANTLLELSAGKGDGEARYAGRSMDGAHFKRESLGLRAEKSGIGEVLDKLEANIYYNYADHIMDNVSLRTPGSGMPSAMPGGAMAMPMSMELDRRTVGGRLMATWIWSTVELRSGGDMQLNTHRAMRRGGWGKDARFHDYGVFSELAWHASDRSKLIGGARLDSVTVDNFTGFGRGSRESSLPAGFLRVEHDLSALPVMVYAGIGYTERFPDYWELFSATRAPDGSANTFNGVNSEKTTQLDIGAHYASERLDGWVSAYVGRVNDFILFRYDPTNARVSQVDNVNATIAGGEAGVSYQWSATWKTNASVAYAWGQNSDNHRPLPQIPPLETRLGVTWEKGDWSSSGLIRLVDSQRRIAVSEGNVVGKDFAHSAGFAIFSANAAWRFNEAVKFSAGVDNMFNKTYSEHLNLAGNSSFGYSAATPINEPGRTFWGKVNVTF